MIDLVGHTLNAAELNKEENILSLTIDGDKIFLIKVVGDCCSEGKFLGVGASRDSSYSLELPSKIVEEKGEKSFGVYFGGQYYQVYDQTYVLENGNELVIAYDNESNGYYGSSLEAYYNGEEVWGKME